MKSNKENRSKLIEERKELDEILNEMGDDVKTVSNLSAITLPTGSSVSYIDFKKIQKECDFEADLTVNSWLEYYLSDDVRKIEYIKTKQKNDKLILSKILYQAKTSEHAASMLLEQINEGNFNPRNFEVLAILEKSQMETVKHYVQATAVMENSYKDIQTEHESKMMQQEDSEGSSISGRGLSHEKILRQLSEESELLAENLENESFEETEFEHVD